jgi:broad specificity phosphatase PhoE
MTRLLLTRHGQSEWNALGRWQGQADPPLSALGRKQAIHAAERIGASDLERAAETAFIIGEAIGVGPVITEPLLRERDAGEWSGLTKVEIEEQWPGYLDEHRRPPAFEPDDTFLGRTLEALASIHRSFPDGEVLVVSHGGLMYILEHDAGLPFERLPNLGARWLDHDDTGVKLGDRVQLIDDALLTTVPAQI